MSGPLLRCAPSHQPPPPSVSKSRSRGSCHDDGVPDLQLNTAHYTSGVVEVDVRRRDPPHPFVQPNYSFSNTISASVHCLSTAQHHDPLYDAQRSRLEADEDPLLDSLSSTEATVSVEVPHASQAGLLDNDCNSVGSSIVFEGHSDGHGDGDGDDAAHTADLVSTSFGAQWPGGLPASHMGNAVNIAEEISMFYDEEEAPTLGSENYLRGLGVNPYDRTVTPRNVANNGNHVAARRPLEVGGQPEQTSRKLVFSASTVLTSPLDDPAVARKEGTILFSNTSKSTKPAKHAPVVGFIAVGDDEVNASSPELRHNDIYIGGAMRTDNNGVHVCCGHMAPLVPPVLADEDEEAAELSKKNAPLAEEAATQDDSPNGGEKTAMESKHDVAKKLYADAALPSPHPLPPTPHSDLDRADAEMESAMKEMAARLRSHDRSRRRLDGEGIRDGNGTVVSKGNSPSEPLGAAASAAVVAFSPSPSATALSPPRFYAWHGDQVDRSSFLSDTPDEPHLMPHGRGGRLDDGLVEDPEDVETDLVDSCRDEENDSKVDDVVTYTDAAVFPRCIFIKSPTDKEKAETGTVSASGYKLFSTQLPPLVNRRAHIQELAKILREGEALLTSPPPNRDTQLDAIAADSDEHFHANVIDVADITPSAVVNGTGGGTHAVGESPLRSPPPPPPPPLRRKAFITSPRSAPSASREASLSLGEAALLHPPPSMATFATHCEDVSASQLQKAELRTNYSGGLPTVSVDAIAAAATASDTTLSSTVAVDLFVYHSTNTCVGAGARETSRLRCGQVTPVDGHTAFTEETAAATGDLNVSNSSLSASPSRRHRPPPRMLCPPTPSPSKSRTNEGLELLLQSQECSDEAVAKENNHDTVLTSLLEDLPLDTFPVVVPHSAIATVALDDLVAPFTNTTIQNSAPVMMDRISSSSECSVLQHFDEADTSNNANAEEDEGKEDAGDSTASDLTASSEAERNNVAYHRSVLLGPTDSSVCTAEEEVPIPLSPECDRAPSLPSQQQRQSSAVAEVRKERGGNGAKKSTVAPSVLCYRSDREVRCSSVINSGNDNHSNRSVTSPLSSGNTASGAAAVASGMAFMQKTSVVRRSLERLLSQEKVRDAGAQLFSHASPSSSSQRTSSHPPVRRSTSDDRGAVAEAAVTPGVWSTVDELKEAHDQKEEDAESFHERLPRLSFPAIDSLRGRHSKASVSDTSSPLPVRPVVQHHPGASNGTNSGKEEDSDDEAHLEYDVKSGDLPEDARAGRPTWQSEIFSGGLFDDEDDDAQTSMEEMLQRAEGKNAVLRLELSAATNRASAAEDALITRNEECAELHTLVDRLQAELAAAREAAAAAAAPQQFLPLSPTHVDVAVQTAEEPPTGHSLPVLLRPSNDQQVNLNAATSTKTMPQDQKKDELSSEEWHRRHDSVALQLAAVKSSMVEQLAVLDRLGLHPPFTEEVVSAAQRRLRHVRVVNAPVRSTAGEGATAVSSSFPAKVRLGDNNSVLSLLAQRKQREQQRKQQLEGVAQNGGKAAPGPAKSRSGSTRRIANAKENVFSS